MTDGDRRAALSAVLAVAAIPAGILNHFATLLFRTYHPAPILTRPDGPAADARIVQAVLLSLLAYGLILAWGLVARVRLEGLRGDRGALTGAGPPPAAARRWRGTVV